MILQEQILERKLEEYIKKAQHLINIEYARAFPSLEVPVLKFTKGGRFYKIWQYEHGEQHLIWAFIDKTNGDIYKPASTQSPAKHARGNIFDKNPLANATYQGPNYLREVKMKPTYLEEYIFEIGLVTVPKNFDQLIKTYQSLMKRGADYYNANPYNQIRVDLFYELKYALTQYLSNYGNKTRDQKHYEQFLDGFLDGVLSKYSGGKFEILTDKNKAKKIIWSIINKEWNVNKINFSPDWTPDKKLKVVDLMLNSLLKNKIINTQFDENVPLKEVTTLPSKSFVNPKNIINVTARDYDKGSKTFSFELSDKIHIHIPPKNEPIYLKSDKSGDLMKFTFVKTDMDGSGEDIYGWRYKSEDGQFKLIIIND